jgi:hypothetical protein
VKHWKKVTEKDFVTIKTLSDAGLSRAKICEVTGRGAGTVYGIASASSLKEYQSNLKEARKQRASTVQGVGTDTVEVTPIIAEPVEDAQMLMVEEMRKMNKILIRLCVAWETTPTKTKKGWL